MLRTLRFDAIQLPALAVVVAMLDHSRDPLNLQGALERQCSFLNLPTFNVQDLFLL